MFTPQIRSSIENSVLCWLATCSNSGQPSVSPKEVFIVRGDSEILIANIASPNSATNIKNNALVCVSFLDVFAQKGHKLYGLAKFITLEDVEFPELSKPLLSMVGPSFKFRSLFQIQVTESYPILAPSYHLVPGTTEQSQRESAYRTYRVRPTE
jgi:uncharacterized protein